MNDRFFGQWLALHVPFENLEDLHDEHIRSVVPPEHYNLALALHHRPDFWRDLGRVKEELEIEAVGSKPCMTILNMVRAKTHLIDWYLAGGSRAEIEAVSEDAPDGEQRAAMLRGDDEPKGMQIVLEDAIMDHARQATDIETTNEPAEAESAREDLQASAKPIAALGPPGTGKTWVIKRCIRAVVQQGGKVLLALPTGQLQSRLRSELRGVKVDVDTCHGAFLLHRQEQESLPLMMGYSLVVLDEFPQLGRAHFDKIIGIWIAAGNTPALVLAGDFHQLPSICGTTPKDSRYWDHHFIHNVKLTESWRTDDATLLEKLRCLRMSVPTRKMRNRILRGLP